LRRWIEVLHNIQQYLVSKRNGALPNLIQDYVDARRIFLAQAINEKVRHLVYLQDGYEILQLISFLANFKKLFENVITEIVDDQFLTLLVLLL